MHAAQIVKYFVVNPKWQVIQLNPLETEESYHDTTHFAQLM